MKAIIVGGGKVGYYLLKTLKEKRFDVTLIEKERNICNRIAEDFESDIICGDGTNLEVLVDAGIERCEIVAAVTGKDEENLIICQVSKLNFNVNRTIARINNPKNRTVFKALGVDRTVCSTEVIANLIEGELNTRTLRPIQTLDRGEIILGEVNITNKSPWRDKTIVELQLPEECLIVSIIREDRLIFPKGNIQIMDRDKVILMTNLNVRNEIEKQVMGD